MPASKAVRLRTDPVAVASKGKFTSQIKAQESDDKPIILSTLDEN